MRLDDVRGFVFDVDGTLVHRAGAEVRPLPGASDVLDAIRASGRPFALFTNGSHMPPAAFARELREAGLAGRRRAAPDAALQHADVPRAHGDVSVLAVRDGLGARVSRGAGVRLVDGSDREASTPSSWRTRRRSTSSGLELAARAVISGARLLTGSYVAAYAGANGPILSRGAMVTAAIAKASGRRPTIVGKPSRAAVDEIERRLGVPTEEIAVIGDDLLLDVALGHLGGSRTVLVRSGISGSIDLGRVPENGAAPISSVARDVADLLDLL